MDVILPLSGQTIPPLGPCAFVWGVEPFLGIRRKDILVALDLLNFMQSGKLQDIVILIPPI